PHLLPLSLHDALPIFDQALPVIRAADGMIKALPTFAGMDGARHYFLAPQNPTELRGTGGLISAYAILTIDHGSISVGPFEDIRSDRKSTRLNSSHEWI